MACHLAGDRPLFEAVMTKLVGFKKNYIVLAVILSIEFICENVYFSETFWSMMWSYFGGPHGN